MAKVFLCYFTKGKPFVRELAQKLRSKNVEVWFDEREISIGDSITDKFVTGIRASDKVIVVWTQASVRWQWAKEELPTVVVQSKKRGAHILPVLREGCDIPAVLKHRRYANFQDNYENALDELIRTIKKPPPRDMLIDPDNLLSPVNILVETMGESLAVYDRARDIKQIRERMRNIHKAVGQKLHMPSVIVLYVYVDLSISNGRALALREFIGKLGEAIPKYPEPVQHELVDYLMKPVLSLRKHIVCDDPGTT